MVGCYIRILHLRRRRRKVEDKPERVMLFDFTDQRESQDEDVRARISYEIRVSEEKDEKRFCRIRERLYIDFP